MDETKLDWNDLRLFLAVARLGGLAAAARQTGRSAPTLGRRMLALESATGMELFIRQARGYTLTAQGHDLVERATAIEGQIAPLHVDRTQPHLVKISAGTWMTHVLCRHAAQIIGEGIALRFLEADHMLDILRREAVIGIRNQRPAQSGLACQRVGIVQFAGYATSPDIRGWAQVMGQTPSARWVASQGNTRNRIEVSTPHSALDLACAGVAGAVLPSFIGDAQPELTRITPPIAQLQHEQWLVTHHEDRFVPEVRRTINMVRRTVLALHSGQFTPRPTP